MNDTHIKVCQKSLYTGFHYEGVMVSLFILPGKLCLSTPYMLSKLHLLEKSIETYAYTNFPGIF